MNAEIPVEKLRCLECKRFVRQDSALTCCKCLSVFHAYCVPTTSLEDDKSEGESNDQWNCQYCHTVPKSPLRGESKPDNVDPKEHVGRLRIRSVRDINLHAENNLLKEDMKESREDRKVDSEEADPSQAEKTKDKCV